MDNHPGAGSNLIDQSRAVLAPGLREAMVGRRDISDRHVEPFKAPVHGFAVNAGYFEFLDLMRFDECDDCAGTPGLD